MKLLGLGKSGYSIVFLAQNLKLKFYEAFKIINNYADLDS